ncbi:MAG: hypothetical protein ACI87E_003652 [Mariniblastus sp.]|jgi:hypothetical protein
MLKLIGAFFVCLWAADMITGLFHWLEDTYCLDSMPLIGNFICEPNIEHHLDPQLMVRTGNFLSRNWFQFSIGGGIFAGLWLIGFANVYTLATVLMASFGNEVHRWNHMSKSGRIVSFLKDTGLIQMQRQHSLHHRPPHNRYYCVLTSQVNAVLEAVNFWRRLEWCVKLTTGIGPKREDRRDSILPKKKNRKLKADKPLRQAS